MRPVRYSPLLLAAATALFVAMPDALVAQAASMKPAPPVFIDDLTWTEIRDRQQAGTRTVLIGTAGQEQKGPHMVDGEHKYVLTHTTARIAQALGDALVAPIITYVPEGSWDPPRGHMTKPGTITLPEDRFVELLLHAGRSLKAGGFTQIIYIGDSGGNQRGMQKAAEQLNTEWAGSARALFIGDYYTKAAEAMRVMLRGRGFSDEDIGSHAGMLDTSELLYVNPKLVRKERLARNGGAPDSGVNGDPTKASAELGAELLTIKINHALDQIRALRAGGSQ
ncbi:creatininase family protein [Gemmatimonas sp.]|uniref:creatininase family protein n=1 Tax=Gemmatimonas sp. TaxID=1962908 RepID=UPI0025C589F7|nr:creatininase family protein [Gemmatimonas sp.]MCA2990853.1 creatininase family protein [Gemmatimonas sp.]